ncbi:hypothetical protein EJA70_24430 [Pseudomonas sp. PB103]|uniref:hypothetical protein n=1 Tax=Pseudomonas sp. PB103 TaxID=2494698 RepID=UPI00131C378F|nr:hypothetical protein [Pseudomonas sp. PB103]KAE9640646.1 hypothetical protein EJA70_24430 [Pseudomonas sp. PB103]
MIEDNNGPDAPYPGPSEQTPKASEGHDSGLENAESEPKQGANERPEDWNPPPGNPGSDQDAQTNRGNGGAALTDDSNSVDQRDDLKEPRDAPASDPESGA